MSDDLTFNRASYEQTEPALELLRSCLDDVVEDRPRSYRRLGELLRDDDTYFWAADRLVDARLEQGWRLLRARFQGLPAYRAAVLERGCRGAFRNGMEVIILGELALEDADAA